MFTASNSLSFIRAPLAFLFLQDDPTIRIFAIIFAMLSDCIDGYLARRNKSVTKLGIILDPAMDKFFVYFALAVFFMEGKLALWQAVAMLARDFFVLLYGALMFAMGQWKHLVFRAIRWGKITTALQFIILIGLVLGISFPSYIFASLIAMGSLGFWELFQRRLPAV